VAAGRVSERALVWVVLLLTGAPHLFPRLFFGRARTGLMRFF
jgi:hypothetical protein